MTDSSSPKGTNDDNNLSVTRTAARDAVAGTDVSKLTIGELLKRTTPVQLWGLIAALFGLAAASFAVGFSLRSYQIEYLRTDLVRAQQTATELTTARDKLALELAERQK